MTTRHSCGIIEQQRFDWSPFSGAPGDAHQSERRAVLRLLRVVRARAGPSGKEAWYSGHSCRRFVRTHRVDAIIERFPVSAKFLDFERIVIEMRRQAAEHHRSNMLLRRLGQWKARVHTLVRRAVSGSW